MNEKKIYDYICQLVDKAYIEDLSARKVPGGVTAKELETTFGIYRSNASAILNALVKKGRLVKIESRPVYFLPSQKLSEVIGGALVRPSYTQKEFLELLVPAPMPAPAAPGDAFSVIIGADTSLTDQVEQAKAAMLYPPHGLHTLILGESGTGKTFFSRAMYNYGLSVRGTTEQEYPYIAFNCADYYHNPQLLMSHLFGYVKGAFTGANEETEGVVEKADGGVLFLDEIHRLPPEGQELLFYLIDTGQYRKLGESGAMRKARVLIIGATTEKPENALLETFMRRIPLTISLPPFREKPLDEKIKAIETFFVHESTTIQRTFIIKPPVIHALAAYDYAGNFGQLSSEIKVLCARTFLAASTAEEHLVMQFEHVSSGIRNHYRRLRHSLTDFPGSYDYDVIIQPSSIIQYFTDKTIDEKSYQLLLDKINHFSMIGYSGQETARELESDIRAYYHSILDDFQHRQINKQEMYKAVEPEIVDFTVEVMQDAFEALEAAPSQKNILVMAFHIKFLLERLSGGQETPDKEVHRDEIRRDYAKELNAAQKLVKRIEQQFSVTVPSSEKYLIAVLLANSSVDPVETIPHLYILAHGNSTASSMAEVCNRLMDCQYAMGIDAPLEQSVEETYRRLLSEIEKHPIQSGIILLADMGSLLQMGDRAMIDTGVPVYTIHNVTTLMALEITRMFCKENNADCVYKEYLNKTPPAPQGAASSGAKRNYAILTVCASGAGTSRAFQSVIEEELAHMGLDIHVAALNYNDVRDCGVQYRKLRTNYELLACVGNIETKIDVPFFHISKMLSQTDKLNFVKFISALISDHQNQGSMTESLAEECGRFLRENVVFVNPDVAIQQSMRFLEAVGLPQTEDYRSRNLSLLLHLGFMIERNIIGTNILFDNEEAFIKENKPLFLHLQNALQEIEKFFDIHINNAEICYIIQTINSDRS